MYITMALNSFAENLIAIFVPIYLWQLGYSIIDILFFYLLWAVYWIIVSPIVVKLISIKGEKHTIFYSSFFLIVYYIGLNYIETWPWLFYILPLLVACRTCFFWIGWHVNFVEHADRKKQGREIALIQIIAVFTNFITPLIGGVIIFWLGWPYAFIIASIVLFFSVWPLLRTKDTPEKIDFSAKQIVKWIIRKKHRKMNLSLFGYASEVIIGRTLWPVFILIIIGSIDKVGAIVSFSMIASMVVLYFIGKLTDKMSRRKIIKGATLFYVIGWIGRIFADSTGFVFGIDTYHNVAARAVEVPWSSRLYDLAKKEKYFEFIVAKEIMFRLSRILFIPILILLFWQFGFIAFFICFGIAAIMSLFYMTL